MIEKEVIICDGANLRKRLREFIKVANEIEIENIDNKKIFQILYRIELFRNAIYKCIKVEQSKYPYYPLPGTEEGISEYVDEYSNEILKIKIYELMPPVKTPYNNKRLERTCQVIAEKHKGLFLNKEVIIRMQVGVPRDNWDIDNRDLRYVFNGFVYGGLISDDNINYVSYMLEGVKSRENYIKILVSEKKNIKKISSIKM